jgi:hypothetical protein
LAGSVAYADGGKRFHEGGEAHGPDLPFNEAEYSGGRRCDRRMRQAEATFMVLGRDRSRALAAIVFAGSGLAESAPQRLGGGRSADAHQRRMGEGLKEVEGNRKQRCGKCRRPPTWIRSP